MRQLNQKLAKLDRLHAASNRRMDRKAFQEQMDVFAQEINKLDETAVETASGMSGSQGDLSSQLDNKITVGDDDFMPKTNQWGSSPRSQSRKSRAIRLQPLTSELGEPTGSAHMNNGPSELSSAGRGKRADNTFLGPVIDLSDQRRVDNYRRSISRDSEAWSKRHSEQQSSRRRSDDSRELQKAASARSRVASVQPSDHRHQRNSSPVHYSSHTAVSKGQHGSNNARDKVTSPSSGQDHGYQNYDRRNPDPISYEDW